MLPGLSSLVVASTLALSPFSTPWTVGEAAHGAWPTKPATETKPAAETKTGSEPAPDPSWDEPDQTEPTTDVPPPTEGTPGDPADAVAPAPVPPPVLPVPAPPPMIVTRPAPPSGLGLMIGAGVTGGLGWLIALAKLSAAKKCRSAFGEAVLDPGASGVDAIRQCARSSGAIVGLTLPGWLVNDVTYGLAPAAGVARGKYDGARAAWDGQPNRKTPVFIGVGAGLLAAGVVGRITTLVVFFRQLNVDRLFAHYPLSAHFVLTQLSVASIQGGAGLLGYGLAYKKMRTNEDARRKAAGIADLRLAPQVGWAYSGLSLTGQF
jgi:hypothetical protein